MCLTYRQGPKALSQGLDSRAMIWPSRVSQAKTFKYFLSAQKVPKGKSDAIKRTMNLFRFHFLSLQKTMATTTYRINNIPCAIPTTWFGSGISAQCFNGMVIPKRSRQEIPSKIAVALKSFSMFELQVNYFIVSICNGFHYGFAHGWVRVNCF